MKQRQMTMAVETNTNVDIAKINNAYRSCDMKHTPVVFLTKHTTYMIESYTHLLSIVTSSLEMS